MVAPVEHRTRDILLAEQQKLLDDINSVKAQISDAKARAAATGGYADRDWFSRANFALKKMQQRYQALQQEIGEANRRARRKEQRARDESFGQAFIDSCRRLLDKDTFAMVMREAQRNQSGVAPVPDEAPPLESDDQRYARLELEHLGDPLRKTGIYSDRGQAGAEQTGTVH